MVGGAREGRVVLCVADKPGEGGSSSPSLQQSQTSLQTGERERERAILSDDTGCCVFSYVYVGAFSHLPHS